MAAVLVVRDAAARVYLWAILHGLCPCALAGRLLPFWWHTGSPLVRRAGAVCGWLEEHLEPERFA